AERAYPEMDKLLKLCDLFGCTLDELVLGDLTVRPADATFRMPSGKALQDVTGYDQVMRSFALKVALGVAAFLVGASL
ncbi:MAG: XRE family transcriptional regulator, partial [Raoultibacter sp.]